MYMLVILLCGVVSLGTLFLTGTLTNNYYDQFLDRLTFQQPSSSKSSTRSSSSSAQKSRASSSSSSNKANATSHCSPNEERDTQVFTKDSFEAAFECSDRDPQVMVGFLMKPACPFGHVKKGLFTCVYRYYNDMRPHLGATWANVDTIPTRMSTQLFVNLSEVLTDIQAIFNSCIHNETDEDVF
jgi:hypothetical protein